MHTTHTALLRSTGAKSARLIYGHPFLSKKSRSFRSTYFSGYKRGEWMVVKFRFSSSTNRRHILQVRAYDSIDSVEAFKKQFDGYLMAETQRADKLTGHETWPGFVPQSGETKAEVPPEAEPVAPIKNWHSGIYIANEDMKIWQTITTLAQNAPINVMMVGPSGYGKTSVPMAVADMNEMKYLRINCAQIRDPEEWFGYREAVSGSTVFVPSEFTQTVTEGNAIVVLDEFNRVEPWLHNTLYPLLDHARETSVHNEQIKCGPNLIFVATINVGYQFTGTFVLDNALMNRMDVIIRVGALPSAIETKLLVDRTNISKEVATSIIRMMGALRQQCSKGNLSADVSTRTSLKIAAVMVPQILSLKEATKFVLVNGLSEEDTKTVIDTVSAYTS